MELEELEELLYPDTVTQLLQRMDYVEALAKQSGSTATIGWVDLIADKWVQNDECENLSQQVVTVSGVPEGFDFESCQVDLTPSAEQLLIFHEKDLTFVTENDGGVVTVYVIGQKPANDYTIQVTITEVSK